MYKKDYYYKHFKALFGKYLKNKLNFLKYKCFPTFIFNNFSTPSYSFNGNAKELDNYNFLSYYLKDILVYKEKKNIIFGKYLKNKLSSFLFLYYNRTHNQPILHQLLM